MNLKNETLEILKKNGKSFDDVEWIGSKTHQIRKEDFLVLADVEYDEGYGCMEVANDLLIVGKDWWLERHEYDGSEWWEFKIIPKKPKEIIESPVKITYNLGGSLEALAKYKKNDPS